MFKRQQTGRCVALRSKCQRMDIAECTYIEAELGGLVETLPQFIWIRRADGSLEYWNQRYADYLQATPEQLRASGWSHWRQFFHPEEQEQVYTAWHLLEMGEPYEVAHRLRNGQAGGYRWFFTRAIPLHNDTGQILKWLGTSTDIDEQKQAEEARCQRLERESLLMNSSILGVFFAEDGQIVEANDTFLRMTGYSREDLREQRVNWASMTLLLPTSLTQQVHQELIIQQGTTPIETELLCKDGSSLPVLLGGMAFHDQVRQGIGFVLDNSARKELERRKEDFLSMASHELKTPLAALRMQLQLVRKRLERRGLHEAVADLARIETPLRQLERLIGELLDISKIQAGRLDYIQEPVDLDALLREVTEAMERMNGSHTIVVHGTAPASLMGDRDRLGQVFINLLSNAIKYSPGANQVEIDVSTSAEAVTVSVQDHGIGIPQEQCEKIFERFYRAVTPHQRAFPGLGIGLSVVSEIVKHHQGTITVESEVGLGSIFHVTLPLTPLGDTSSEEVPPRSLPKEAIG